MRSIVLLLLPAFAHAGEIVHNYAPLCPDTSALGPGPGEEGHIAVTRLMPRVTPFTIETVRAKLHHGQLPNARCDASGAHRMQLWVGTELEPEANPTIVASPTFPAEEVIGTERTLQATLQTPIVLEEGQYLFVSVDFGGTHPDVGCIATCRTGPVDAAYWSNADQAPYDWRSLDDFGLQADLWIEAVGNGPPEEVVEEAPAEEAPAPEPERGRHRRDR